MAYIQTPEGEKVGHKYYATIGHAIDDAVRRLRPQEYGTELQVYAGDTHTHTVVIQPEDSETSKVVLTEYWPAYLEVEYSIR